MGSISATYSMVESYKGACSGNYNAILSVASGLVSQAEHKLSDLQLDLENIQNQIIRAKTLQDEVATIMNGYKEKMEEAAEEIARWQEEIDYWYSHPEIRTYTDSEGNEVTEEVYNYAAISAAESKKAEAQKIYDFYEEKYNYAKSVYDEINDTIIKLDVIQRGINTICETIKNYIYEIKKYIQAIADESDHNIQALSGVIDSLSVYLASKSIYFPNGSGNGDFSSSGGAAASANHSSGSSKSDINTVDLQAINHMYTDATIQTALGIAGRVAVSGFGMVTGLSDPTGSASAAAAKAFQIAGPVVIEAFSRMVRSYINTNSTNTDNFYRDHFMRTQDGIPITPEQGREIAINEMVTTLTGNSESVINAIANEDQLQIYMEAGLEYNVVNNRECLVRDIDPDYVDKKTGLTNRELMLLGRAPYDSDTGERIELHHMGQTFDAPFAELAENSEHGDGNFNTLHQSRSESWRKDHALCSEYARQRRMHWIERGRNL